MLGAVHRQYLGKVYMGARICRATVSRGTLTYGGR